MFACSLDQLDRTDTPSVSEAYAMTVAFKTLLALVNSIDALVKSTLTKEEVKVEGWIEPSVEEKTTDKTGVGTEAVVRNKAEEGSCEILLTEMFEKSSGRVYMTQSE